AAVVLGPGQPRAQVVERLGDRAVQRVVVLGPQAPQGDGSAEDQLVRPVISLATHRSAPPPPSAGPSGRPPPAPPARRRRSRRGPPPRRAGRPACPLPAA